MGTAAASPAHSSAAAAALLSTTVISTRARRTKTTRFERAPLLLSLPSRGSYWEQRLRKRGRGPAKPRAGIASFAHGRVRGRTCSVMQERNFARAELRVARVGVWRRATVVGGLHVTSRSESKMGGPQSESSSQKIRDTMTQSAELIIQYPYNEAGKLLLCEVPKCIISGFSPPSRCSLPMQGKGG